MSLIFTYDSETTGIPNWKIPSDSPEQPHIVSLAGVLTDTATGEDVVTMDVIVKPDGWTIPEETIAIHGITNEHALEHGIPEKEAIELLSEIRGDHMRVSYNKSFDQRIIRIAMKRYFDEECVEKWADKESHDCAMMAAKKHLDVKSIKLGNAYKLITGKDLIGAHTAMADALAAKEIYFKVNGLGGGKYDF